MRKRGRHADWAEHRLGADVDEEVRYHLEARIEDLERAGLTTAEARERALEEFGDVASVSAELRAIDRRARGRRRWRERFAVVGIEMKRAVRTLARERSFAGIALLTLAMGVGAAAAIFSLLDGVVLRPLPYPESGRLVRLYSAVPGVGADARWGLARAEFLHFREQNSVFDGMGLYQITAVTVSGDGPGERVFAAWIEPGVTEILGITPAHGRLIRADENLQRRAAVAIISHSYFQRRFGGDASVVGRSIRVDGVPIEIVGVLPRGARLPEELAAPAAPIDLWLPLWLDPADRPRNHHAFLGLARLAPGSEVISAQAEMDRLTARLPETLPEAYSASFMESSGFRTIAEPLRDDVVGGLARTLWMLFAGVGLVFVIAAANVANLFVARIESKRRDIAVRASLGASQVRARLGYFLESLTIAVASAGLAALFATALLRLVVLTVPGTVPRIDEVTFTARGIGFTMLLALGAGLILGLMPLLRRGGDLSPLRGEGRTMIGSRAGSLARSVLVTGQFALALVLITGAGLLLRSFASLRAVEPGFQSEGVVAATVRIAPAGKNTYEAMGAFYYELVQRAGALPGVRSVGLTTGLPFASGTGCTSVTAQPSPGPSVTAAGAVNWDVCVPDIMVSPGYFETMGIPVRGTTMTWAGMNAGTAGAVISETLAERFWPGRDPIGHTIGTSITGSDPAHIVTGVAGDVRFTGLDRPPIEAVYFPILRIPTGPITLEAPYSFVIAMRAQDGPGAIQALRTILAEMDPESALGPMRIMTELVGQSMARTTFSMRMLLVAGLMGVLLSAVGVYGVIAYLVRQRSAEMGIRMALGAPAAHVGSMVVIQSIRLAAAGVVIGLIVAALGTSLIRSQLFGVEPTDPLTLGAAVMLLLIVAVLASALPARRAARINPTDALRSF
ncbi:MAG: ABC transporter permease [Gemmatimonadetes bacterium]|nr:ABC transporter permease [Gemmatimonadota bacterium]